MIFYVGLLIGSPVFSYLGQRYNTARVISIVILVWGVVAICSAALQDYSGTMVQRFFLGFVSLVSEWECPASSSDCTAFLQIEAAINPCFLLYTR